MMLPDCTNLPSDAQTDALVAFHVFGEPRPASSAVEPGCVTTICRPSFLGAWEIDGCDDGEDEPIWYPRPFSRSLDLAMVATGHLLGRLTEASGLAGLVKLSVVHPGDGALATIDIGSLHVMGVADSAALALCRAALELARIGEMIEAPHTSAEDYN